MLGTRSRLAAALSAMLVTTATAAQAAPPRS